MLATFRSGLGFCVSFPQFYGPQTLLLRATVLPASSPRTSALTITRVSGPPATFRGWIWWSVPYPSFEKLTNTVPGLWLIHLISYI